MLGGIVSTCIVYELSSNLHYKENITLENCLFVAAKLTNNSGISKCKYCGYGIVFHRHGRFGQNVIIFGVDMSSSVYVDNKKRYFNSW